MKKLWVFVSAALLGVSAYAGVVPRVYDYSACLNTAIARNATRVSFVDCDGQRVTLEDVCYRVKGNVSIRGVVVFGCNCVDAEELGHLAECGDPISGPYYPLVLMATSIDKFTEVVRADADISVANRIGAPISSRALVAELGFDTHFGVGGANRTANATPLPPIKLICGRMFDLWHAGFGIAGIIEKGEGYDFISVSGNVVGKASAPVCSAELNNCPRCQEDGICQYAVAFPPCTISICDEIGTGVSPAVTAANGDTLPPPIFVIPFNGVAYGTFVIKFNKRLSDAIKPIPQTAYQDTIDALVPLAFGSNAIPPDVVPDVILCLDGNGG